MGTLEELETDRRDNSLDNDNGPNSCALLDANNEEHPEQAHGECQDPELTTRFQKFASCFNTSVEGFFYRLGYSVASRPYQSITACILFTLICSMGLMNFVYEDRPDKLLIFQKSQLAYDTDWLRNNFPSPVRYSAVMLTADNVLTPQVFKMMLELEERVRNITVKGKMWNEICFKLPVTKGITGVRSRKRRDSDNWENDFDQEFDQKVNITDDPFRDTTLSIPDELYCSYVDELDEACWQFGPLELWGYNRTVIENLTQEEIVKKVNNEKISPVFGRPVNYTAELGGTIVVNGNGEIISAQSILLFWAVAVNKTAIQRGEAVRDDGTGELADELSLAWEKEWLRVMEEVNQGINRSSMNFHYVSGRSFGDVYKATMYSDLKIAVVGYAVMFFYVSIQLGKFNKIEQRPYLSVAGISCAALAGIITCGICGAFGLPFGNINKVLPFLLLGVGVDDMFVIMQCWNNLYSFKNYKDPLPVRIGNAVKTAGASVTVTSLTDMAAFGIGATTLLPGLRSFCIYATVGIFIVYLLQLFLFVACLAIDQARIEDRRNAYFFWIKYSEEEYVPSKWSQSSYLQRFFETVLATVILSTPGKVAVIIITVIVLTINGNGNLRLRQEFDPMWFLSHTSHIVKYIDARKVYYPSSGFNGFIVGYNVNWTASFNGFETFMENMKHSNAIHTFNPWYEDFKRYSNINFKTDIPKKHISDKMFRKYMGKFLFSRIGARYRLYFRAKKEIACGERTAPLEVSMMPFKFKTFRGREEHIPGMNELKSIVRNANITYYDGTEGKFFAWSAVFVSWETDEIITDELYRNVSLSFVCVMLAIFFLLFNVRLCVFCGICVIATVIDVGGVMYYWGMSIDTISVVANVVAIGLCIDYAAHIGLAFLHSEGTKNARAAQALKEIGPAVLNGGFSTFLGIVLLAGSETHALQSFFKVLTTVVTFGLWHGLIFLPVLLSIFGPERQSKSMSNHRNPNQPSSSSRTSLSKMNTAKQDQDITLLSDLSPETAD